MDDYIKSILGNEMEVVRVVDYGNYLYVFYKSKSFYNPYKDERLAIISSNGPLKINKTSKDYEFTKIYDFLIEFGENKLFFPLNLEKKLNLDDVIKNIILRKRINWDDFDLLLEINKFPIDIIEIYSLNKRDVIEIDVKNEDVKNCIIDFLSKIGAKYEICNLHFEISQNI